jgi:hypothetical protein
MPDTSDADAASAWLGLQIVARVLVFFLDGSQQERGDTDNLMSFLWTDECPGHSTLWDPALRGGSSTGKRSIEA